jgi:BirA family biotin operon repressor/biotin-[acetyl-CoA-carboxylase] ligase
MSATKGKILKLLREESAILSGETLSNTLGLSRTAIWKHIQKLQACGYDISASGKGYQLMAEPDAPYPWEFPGREEAMHFYPEVSSTMDIARKHARGGCPALTVVVAERQTLGRGRLQRHWHSEAGGLYFTVVMRPNLAVMVSLRVNFCASLVMALTLQQLYRIHAAVKWPNDILVGDRKIAGMLSEMEAETDRVAYVNVGIGLNVNNDPSPAAPGAVTLKETMGHPVSRKAILATYLDALEVRLKTIDTADVIAEWKTQTVTLGRKVRIQTQQEVAEGTAVDVDENGSLILRLGDGSLKTILYGDCFHL